MNRIRKKELWCSDIRLKFENQRPKERLLKVIFLNSSLLFGFSKKKKKKKKKKKTKGKKEEKKKKKSKLKGSKRSEASDEREREREERATALLLWTLVFGIAREEDKW